MNHHTFSNVSYSSKRDQRIRMSKHAQKRCQQRGTDQAHVPLLRLFGEAVHDGKGATCHSMTQAAMRNMYRVIGYTKKLETLAGRYIVVSIADGTVITCGHIYQ
jgi:hypothetical protein